MKDVVLIKYRDVGTDNLNGKRHFHDNELEILQIISGNGVMTIKDKLYPIFDNTVFLFAAEMRIIHHRNPPPVTSVTK